MKHGIIAGPHIHVHVPTNSWHAFADLAPTVPGYCRRCCCCCGIVHSSVIRHATLVSSYSFTHHQLSDTISVLASTSTASDVLGYKLKCCLVQVLVVLRVPNTMIYWYNFPTDSMLHVSLDCPEFGLGIQNQHLFFRVCVCGRDTT